MNSLKALKAMGQEDRIHDLLRREIKELNQAHQHITTAKGAVTIGQEVAGVVVLAAGAYVALAVYRIDLAQIAVLAALFQRALGQINQLQGNWQSMLNTQSGLWAILGLIRQAESEREALPGESKTDLSKAIEFDDVRFAYGDRQVLDRVTFAIAAGQLTVIVGPSGAGKTTLIDLVCRLYEPTEGRITVDGISLQTIDRSAWRASIGYVPQDVPLFHDSIRQNVTLGDPAIDAGEIRLALERAGAWSFVSAIPEGIDAPVGERGGRLSGGQRQRIAIARALVRRPKLLILDEPTAALDEATELELCRTLAELARHTTVLAISHRPALAEVADRVVRLEAGRIVEQPASVRIAGAS
jgi:ATP-binding cassette subfamily C protein